jgi:hypothetical protein
MRQSIHIFLKDARHLRSEIALFLVVSAIYAWAQARRPYPIPGPEWLLAITAIFLIARVVHAEPIPGDNQFWVTRPYRRISLAGAKLLFIAVCVCAPICVAQLSIVLRLGAPLLSGIQGLLWSQVLIFLAGSFVAALAAVTSGTVLFMMAVLLLTTVGWIAEIVFPIFIPSNGLYRFPEPLALLWVREYVALALLALTAVFVLHRQYRNRATALSRTMGVLGIVAAVSAYLCFPSALVYAVQSFGPKLPPAANAIQASIDPVQKRSGATLMKGGDPLHERVVMSLPIVVRGLPDRLGSRVDAVSVSFEWPGKQSWKPDITPGVNPRFTSRGVSLGDATVVMDAAIYRENRVSPLTLTGAAYVTLFGDAETRTATVQARPVNLQDGLQCFAGDLDYLICRSFFRWPGRLIYADSAGQPYNFLNTLISYSPFPADAGLTVVNMRTGGEISPGLLTLTTQKPVAHFWRRFQTTGIRLSDFEGPNPPPVVNQR